MKKSLQILNKNNKYIIAVSGGVDSMSLLHLLHNNDYEIVVCYVNHNIRKDTFLDENLVVDYCNKNNITIEKTTLDYTNKVNFHDESHHLRYNFFKTIAKKYNTNHIITAHHGDDLIETILIKLIRGSNLYGYSGIRLIDKKDDFYFYKPLLNYSKQDIIKYASDNNVLYLEDSSNSKDYYLRNRIRKNIIPLLKEESTNLIDQSIKYSNILFESFNYIRNTSSNYINNNTFSLKEFTSLDITIKKDILNYLLETNNLDSSYNKINDLITLLNSNKPNLKYDLGNNKLLIKRYDLIKIENKKNKVDFFYLLNKNDIINHKGKEIFFTNKISNEYTNYLKICYNELLLPLEVRNRKNGDEIKLKFGTKKIKDLFINLKIPKDKRDEIILIVSNNKVIWIPELNIKTEFENSNGFIIYKE